MTIYILMTHSSGYNKDVVRAVYLRQKSANRRLVSEHLAGGPGSRTWELHPVHIGF